MHTLSYKNLYAMLMLGMIFLPSPVSASSVYIDTTHSEFFVGDTILFSVRIDSENKNINAIEGEVLLDHAAGAVSLVGITTSGSVFPLWPGKPLPSERNTRVSFVGGSPGGLLSKEATVFNIVLKLQEAGQIALSPDHIEVYIHDGKGTKDEVSTKDLIIDVLPKKSDVKATDDWSAVMLGDTTAPEPFEVYLGQEGSVFDGKKFLSFNTTDTQSGISYYEVIENDLPPARSNGTYVLQEQHTPVTVRVIAYDSAGNAMESVYQYSPTADAVSYPATPSYLAMLVLIGSIIVGMILLVVVFKKMRKART